MKTETKDSFSFAKFFPRPIKKIKIKKTCAKPPYAKTHAMINKENKTK